MIPRPRIALIAGLFIVAAVCARLGVWQVHRLRERRAANAAALAARSAPPATIERIDPDLAELVNRRVRASGRYDHEHDIVLRGREYMGTPGVEIVSPLVIGDGAAVLVNRGFVPTPDAVTVYADSLREPGEQRVEGIALAIASGGGAPLRRGRETTWARLDLPALHAGLPYAIAPVYIRQSPGSGLPRFPRRLDPPALDDGPHLSYAIQWFAFGIIAVVFAGIMARLPPERKLRKV